MHHLNGALFTIFMRSFCEHPTILVFTTLGLKIPKYFQLVMFVNMVETQ